MDAVKIIIDIPDSLPGDTEIVIRPARPRWRQLYDQLDLAQQRAREAQDWIDRCSCNPANGGSGICGCVIPQLQVLS